MTMTFSDDSDSDLDAVIILISLGCIFFTPFLKYKYFY